MNFKDEYRKSAESLSPDRKTIDRMKAAVMAEINSGTEEKPRSRKPLPMNRIALIGGAAAACAVITLSAVAFIPMIRNNSDMVSEAGSSNSSAAVNSSYSDVSSSSTASAGNLPQGFDAAGESLAESGTIISDPDSGSDSTPDSANSEQYDPTDASHSDNEIDFPNDKTQQGDGLFPSDPAVGISSAAPNENPDISSGVTSDFSSGYTEEAAITMTESTDDRPGHPCTGAGPEGETAHSTETEVYTAEIADYSTDAEDHTSEFSFATVDAATAEPDEPDYTAEFSYEDMPGELEGTAEFATEEYGSAEVYGTAEESEEVQPEYQYRLVLTGKGWLTFNGERYDQIKNAADPGAFRQAVQAIHIIDRQMYSVYMDNDTLYLYQNNGDFLGAFAKKLT